MLNRLTPVLYVDAIEPALPFWTAKLGFSVTAQVPQGERLGFAIVERDGVEVMYQTWESVAADLPSPTERTPFPSTGFYVEVEDLGAVEQALGDLAPAVPRRSTPYGATEIGWREPGGHIVLFAEHSR